VECIFSLLQFVAWA